MLSIILASLIVQESREQYGKLPLQTEGVCYRAMELYDSVAIVTPIRLGPLVRRESPEQRSGATTQKLTVRIVHATWTTAGSEVTFIAKINPGGLHLAPPDPTQRYLIVGRKARNGHLEIPVGSWGAVELLSWVAAEDDSERVAYLMYRTEATRLPATGTPAERLAFALAECLVPAHGSDLRDLVKLHENSRYPGVRSDERPLPPLYIEPTPLTRRMAEIAMTKPLVERAYVQGILLVWSVLYAYQPYMRTLYACLQDPDAFVNPPENYEIPTYNIGTKIPPGYSPVPLSGDRCVDDLLAARNAKVKALLVWKSFAAPSVDQQRRYAQLLDDPNRRVRAGVVRSFAGWRGMREQTVTTGRYDDERRDWTYPGLDQKVAWWKQYWREH
jgi:hypothetical protein